jgi:hypothetical protein
VTAIVEQVGDELKLDFNKPDWSLFPMKAAEEIIRVLEFGAKKYSRGGWKGMYGQQDRIIAAMLRHIAKHQDGEFFDDESGLSHLAHIGCNIMFLLEFNREKQCKP